MILVRRAEEGDASALPEVERSAAASFRLFADLAWVADGEVRPVERHLRSIRHEACWVATEESRVVGFLCAERHGSELHVGELSVLAERQRRGIGGDLLRAALDFAQAEGLEAATLTTFREVPWNEPFYARLGFRTLSADELSPRLAETLRREVAHGFPADRRCAMRFRLAQAVEVGAAEDEHDLHERALRETDPLVALDLWRELAARGAPDAPERLRAYATCDDPRLRAPARATLAALELSHDEPMP